MIREVRIGLITIVLVLILTSFSQVISFPENGPDEVEAADTPTRGEQFYLDGSFSLAPSWNEEKMMVVAFLQNKDDYDKKGENQNGEDYGDFFAKKVANSLTVPLNDMTYSTGNYNYPEKRVLVELFTGTDCVYCPAAEGATGDMIENDDVFPNKVSVIEYYVTGDPTLVESVSTATASKYKATGTPTTAFDGEDFLVGGNPAYNDPVVRSWYYSKLNEKGTYNTTVLIRGSGSNNDTKAHFNVSVEVIGALPRGNWSLKAVLCEDLYPREHSSAPIRFVARSFRSVFIPQLGEGVPDVTFDEVRTYEDMAKEHRGNLTVYWSAYDQKDGTNLEIDLMAKTPTTGWMYIAQGLDNTGSYKWDTQNPRVPDSKGYRIQVIARDSDDKESSDMGIQTFDLNNPDFPLFNLISPKEGDEIVGGIDILWDANDGEDDTLQLMVSCMIRPEDGSEWEALSRDPLTGDTLMPNQNALWFNSDKIDLGTGEPRYPDGFEYRLKFVIKDRDDMMTEFISPPFGVYNNDMPTARILSPVDGEVISETLDIGWEIGDQEDPAYDLFTSFSLSKDGGEYLEIHNGSFDDAAGNLTFTTQEIGGDGGYRLRLEVTDSRNLGSEIAVAVFSIYDPDPPTLYNLTGPKGEVKGTRTFRWESSDADAEETATYKVSIRPISGEWTVLADGMTERSYLLDTIDFEDGDYELKVTAWDTSDLRLSDEEFFKVFTINNPDAPTVKIIGPGVGDVLNTTVEILWLGNDPDGDNLTYNLYYHVKNNAVWTPIVEGKTNTRHMWNFSTFEEGEYFIKVEVVDSSEEALSYSTEVGPVTLKVYIPPEVEDPIDRPTDGSGDEEVEDNKDLLYISLAVAGFIGLVLLMGVIVMVLFARANRKKREGAAIPENDGDLLIPDIESIDTPAGIGPTPVQPIVYQGQMPQGEQMVQQPVPQQAPPAQMAAQPDPGMPVPEQAQMTPEPAAQPQQAVQEAPQENLQPAEIPQQPQPEQPQPDAVQAPAQIEQPQPDAA
ncbi:MAG: hypothetical protein KAH57_07085 [Thermoplasmata archaeon]|nr:hypothetical protein [Thermoplasmata archaeon]